MTALSKALDVHARLRLSLARATGDKESRRNKVVNHFIPLQFSHTSSGVKGKGKWEWKGRVKIEDMKIDGTRPGAQEVAHTPSSMRPRL